MADTKSKLKVGTECIAKYDFHGSSPKDLAFNKGDILIVLHHTEDPNWYQAKKLHGNQQGTIPAQYVQPRNAMNLHTMPWYFGKITREQAEELLIPGEPGLFLVRESTNYPGDYTLCVCSPVANKVEHYRIITNNGRLSVDNDGFFDDLPGLVEHYQQDRDGLCSRLKIPFKKSKNQAISSKAFLKSFEKEGWVLNLYDVILKDIIGSGEFGEVYNGEYKGNQVAVKKLKDDKETVQAFMSEASVMTTLHHKNLVELIGVCFKEESIYILTEYCSKGALVGFLRSRGRAVITQADQRQFARDVCLGMVHLEERHVVHRDLAARNVLLAEDMTAKVSDFGLARTTGDDDEAGKFPVKWTAPEAITSKQFSTQSDIWSFGILLWEIYSFGRNPYPRIPLNSVLDKVTHGYRMEPPEGCPHNMYELMKRCWQIDPKRRPKFSQIIDLLEHQPTETLL